jgi:hypothetical protein
LASTPLSHPPALFKVFWLVFHYYCTYNLNIITCPGQYCVLTVSGQSKITPRSVLTVVIKQTYCVPLLFCIRGLFYLIHTQRVPLQMSLLIYCVIPFSGRSQTAIGSIRGGNSG